jgi:hypothetical protein
MRIEATLDDLVDGDVFYLEDDPDCVQELLISEDDECEVRVIGSDFALPLPEENEAIVIIHNTRGLRTDDERAPARAPGHYEPGHP